VHEGIWFEHHCIASGGYHSVRSLTVLVFLWFEDKVKWTVAFKLRTHCRLKSSSSLYKSILTC
jgi:hypothetical protein